MGVAIVSPQSLSETALSMQGLACSSEVKIRYFGSDQRRLLLPKSTATGRLPNRQRGSCSYAFCGDGRVFGGRCDSLPRGVERFRSRARGERYGGARDRKLRNWLWFYILANPVGSRLNNLDISYCGTSPSEPPNSVLLFCFLLPLQTQMLITARNTILHTICSAWFLGHLCGFQWDQGRYSHHVCSRNYILIDLVMIMRSNKNRMFLST